ncbi:DUF4173 domain-containing protein [Radiobacillus kanasensis]|uniref:DUF4153 domain-containing protein n=1 Tax=Radiobacillus kanasensis TaxID=2844358 RepID=UPI001E33344C|nr:DUF4173 domain-containing protein [Radiobacillus kanasensis]UFT99798.1 DUF4173 domain-containing protein [Radiobacillus kanasensis]
MKVERNDIQFFIICLALAILAEISFFHGTIGVSYLVFIIAFYSIFFIRFRKVAFTHRRIGTLCMFVIWMLAASYFVYDNPFLYQLNILVIPVLMFIHIILVTSPKSLQWHTPPFLIFLFSKIGKAIKYNKRFMGKVFHSIFRNADPKTGYMIKRIITGLLIGGPILIVVTILLMSADTVFSRLVWNVPTFILELNVQQQIFRTVAVLIFWFVFFGVFQVLTLHYRNPVSYKENTVLTKGFDSVVALTILLLLNTVYVLFTVIQFTYFFGGNLQEGLTYAEYARKGFFELILVTMINWTLLTSFLKWTRTEGERNRVALKSMYSLLVLVSGIMLASAYQRLSLYEAAYGFTYDRLLAHAFMIYLMIIFAYTFIRIWMEKLSLFHFYIIASLLFYTALNVIPFHKVIVENNLDRFEETGKIDLDYLNTLSYTGVEGVIDIYEENPDHIAAQQILRERMQRTYNEERNWQAYNITRSRVIEQLKNLDVD